MNKENEDVTVEKYQSYLIKKFTESSLDQLEKEIDKREKVIEREKQRLKLLTGRAFLSDQETKDIGEINRMMIRRQKALDTLLYVYEKKQDE